MRDEAAPRLPDLDGASRRVYRWRNPDSNGADARRDTNSGRDAAADSLADADPGSELCEVQVEVQRR